MRLFNRRNNKELPPLMSDEEIANGGFTYDDVVDFLRGLSDGEYAQVCKVAEVYRQADVDAANALGIINKPYRFINPPTPKADPNELDFMEDIKPAKGRKNAKKN